MTVLSSRPPFSRRISAIIGEILYISTISGIHVESLLPYICLALAAFATTCVLTPSSKIAIKLDAVDFTRPSAASTPCPPAHGRTRRVRRPHRRVRAADLRHPQLGLAFRAGPPPQHGYQLPHAGPFFSTIVATGAGRCSHPKAKLAGRVTPPCSPPPVACSSMPSSSTRSKRAKSPGLFAYPITIIWWPIPISSTSSAWTVSPPASPPSRAVPCSPSPS